MKGVWRRLPWWVKLLFGVGILVGFLFYWKYILAILVGGFFLWILVRVVQVRQSWHDNDVHIHLHDDSIQPRGSSWINRGLGTNYYAPRVNRTGANFITGAPGLRKTQRDAMRRTKKNLWG